MIKERKSKKAMKGEEKVTEVEEDTTPQSMEEESKEPESKDLEEELQEEDEEDEDQEFLDEVELEEQMKLPFLIYAFLAHLKVIFFFWHFALSNKISNKYFFFALHHPS